MIFAEIGLNHLGSKKYANYYLEKLLSSKVDCISFQIKKNEFYLSYKKAFKSKDCSFYSDFRDKKIYELLFKKKKFQSLKLTKNFYIEARKKCRLKKKKFGIALGDIKLVNFFSSINTDFVKILSEDFDNTKLIQKLLNSRIKKIYISTGNVSFLKIKKFVNSLSKKEIKKVGLIHTSFNKTQSINNLNKIIKIRKIHKQVSYGLHAYNKKILLKLKKYKPDSIFFYIKGEISKFHPDDNHALSFFELDYYVTRYKGIQ